MQRFEPNIRYREQFGMTCRALAEKYGVSRNTINRWAKTGRGMEAQAYDYERWKTRRGKK